VEEAITAGRLTSPNPRSLLRRCSIRSFFGFVNVPVPANLVLSSFTQNKGGWNVGGGVSFRVKGDSNFKVYAEARYHYIYTTPVQTTILPVTFGLRW
jgi:hypothetical protein